MLKITPKQMAAAIRQHAQLTTLEKRLVRCDELAVLQKLIFMDLVSLARDGATDPQVTELIGFLSIMQYLTEGISKQAARPVEVPEFRAGIAQAYSWLGALDVAKEVDKEEVIVKWFNNLQQKGQPVIWAQTMSTLKQHDILTSELMRSMVITIYGITNVFSKRLEKLN